MSINKLKEIKMTSNSTPNPFNIEPLYNETLYNSPHSDFYKMFDKDDNTYFKIASEKRISFNISIDENIYLSKVIINYKNDGNCNIESGSIYGIDDNNESTLLSNKIKTYSNSSIYSSELEFKKNITKYKKFSFNLNVSSEGNYLYIHEIQFYLNIKKLIFTNNLYYGYDSDKTIISFNDINSYNKYYFLLQNLNNDIDILKDKYPFKIIKIG